MYAPMVGDRLDSLDTPFMIIDLDIIEVNIKNLIDTRLPIGLNIRPHLKAIKSAILVRKLNDAGAKGGYVANIREAKAITTKGFTDLIITYKIIGLYKVIRSRG